MKSIDSFRICCFHSCNELLVTVETERLKNLVVSWTVKSSSASGIGRNSLSECLMASNKFSMLLSLESRVSNGLFILLYFSYNKCLFRLELGNWLQLVTIFIDILFEPLHLKCSFHWLLCVLLHPWVQQVQSRTIQVCFGSFSSCPLYRFYLYGSKTL